MRALLVVNPTATTTTPRTQDVLVSALASDLKVETAHTSGRGDGVALGERAREQGVDLVVVLGGDGTVNEVVNGLLGAGPGLHLPALALVPGGSTNVLARSLGLPRDPVEATGLLLQALRARRDRHIGLGLANERYFTFCAGLGFDAEVVNKVERQRARGRRPTAGRYVRTTVRHFFAGADRRQPAITLERPGAPPVHGLFLAIVANTSPWTYLGSRTVDPCPQASFDTGLDLLALRRMATLPTLRHAGQMLGNSGKAPHGKGVVHEHDLAEFTLTASRDLKMQVDGDHVGLSRQLRLRAVPRALRIVT